MAAEPALKLVNPEVQEVTTLALSVPDQAKAIAVIKTPGDYIKAGEILITIKEIRKKIEATFKPIKQKMDAAKKEVLDQEKTADAPLKEAEDYIKPLIRAYDDEQERIRREEERRLQEEARKREEEERLAAALAAEEEGDKEAAQAIIEEEVYVPPVVIPKATPQVQGVSFRENWKHQVIDLMALVKAVAAGQVPINALNANDVFLGQQARSLKGAMKYPGVKVYSEKVVAAGRR